MKRKRVIRNDPCPASLELRKVYEVLPDPDAARSRWIRVIDESGEVYDYPEECYIPVDLPPAAAAALRGGEQSITELLSMALRYEGWEVYPLGMGLDLNTLERQGASSEAFSAPAI